MESSESNNLPDQHANHNQVDHSALDQMALIGSVVGSYLHEEKSLLSLLSSQLSDLFHSGQDSRAIRPHNVNKITRTVERLRQHHNAIASLYSRDWSISHPSPLQKVVETEMLLEKQRCISKNIHVGTEIGPDTKYIEVPDLHFRQVIRELLSNSVRTLDMVHGRKKRVSVRSRKNLDRLEITVADNGSGIPPELKDIIWNIGFTTSSNRFGVGLYIVKILVEKYKGKVWEDGIWGKGCSFHIDFPINWRT